MNEYEMRFETWLKSTCGSAQCKNLYHAALERFFRETHTDLETFLTTWRNVRYDLRLRDEFCEDWSERIEAYVLSKPYASGTKNTLFAMLKSFFKYCKIPIEIKKIRHVFVTYHNRDITKEEIRSILENADLRDRCFFLMMAESGLRPNTLVQLKWKHIKEEFLAGKIPMKISLPSSIMKCRVSERWTFIGEDGVNMLKEYLKTREPLNDGDFLFVQQTSSRKVFDEQGKRVSLKRADVPVTAAAFSSKFEEIVERLELVKRPKEGEEGFKKPQSIRLYNLRKYFKKYAKCDQVFVEYWMGHSSTETHYVSTDPEHHRQVYVEAYENMRVLAPDLNKQLLANLNAEVEGKKRELAELSERVRKLEPLLKLVELLGVDDEATREKFFEELKTLKSAKLVATEKI
jgi:integrase